MQYLNGCFRNSICFHITLKFGCIMTHDDVKALWPGGSSALIGSSPVHSITSALIGLCVEDEPSVVAFIVSLTRFLFYL